MKNTTLLFAAAALLLGACSTAQIAATRAIADPITVALVSGYAQSYGLPPTLTAPVITTLQNQAWGMVAQKDAGNSIAQGADIPSVGTAVAAQNPTTSQLRTAIDTLTQAKSSPALSSAILSAAASSPSAP